MPASPPPAPIVVQGVDGAERAPTAVYQYASALRRLGTAPRHVWLRGDEVWALTRDVRPERLGRLAVDAALAAAEVRATCACGLRSYRLVTDRFGFDLATIAHGAARPAGDDDGPLDDRVVRMDGASPAAVRRMARVLMRTEGRPGARRVTRVIVRDGETWFALAVRPATAQRYVWTPRGFIMPAP